MKKLPNIALSSSMYNFCPMFARFSSVRKAKIVVHFADDVSSQFDSPYVSSISCSSEESAAETLIQLAEVYSTEVEIDKVKELKEYLGGLKENKVKDHGSIRENR